MAAAVGAATLASASLRKEVHMSQIATHDTDMKHARHPVAKGATFSGLMVAAWSVFLTLLVVSPETLDEVYDWLTGLWIGWEIAIWIVLLPWALAYLVWESSWDQWLRILAVGSMAAAHLIVSAPRPKS
jgi:ABC-type Fe3+-siderophore transport system permease subunit